MNLNGVEHEARATLTTPHPLASLTPGEISKVVRIIQASPLFSDKTRFETIELLEPPKAVIRALIPGQRIPREARANNTVLSKGPRRRVAYRAGMCER